MSTGIWLGGGGDTEDIEAELGADPSGSFSTVQDRLNKSLRNTVVNPAAASVITLPGITAYSSSSTSSTLANTSLWYFPFFTPDYLTFDRVVAEVTTQSGTGGAVARIGLYNADASWQPTGTLIEEFGTIATDSTGVKTITPSGGSRTIPGGRYLLAYHHSAVASPTFTVVRGGLTGSPLVMGALTSGTFVSSMSVTRAYAAFPSSPVTWTTLAGSSTGFLYPIFLRVTAEG